MSEPKTHHFVPDFFLRRFANSDGRVAVRNRVRGWHVSATANVFARSQLYRVPGRRLTAEYTLGDFESAASTAFREIDSGGIVSLSPSNRSALALLMALQLTRRPDSDAVARFAREATAAIGRPPFSRAAMSDYLEKLYQFAPRDPEVEAACTMAEASLSQSDPSVGQLRSDEIERMFDVAVRVLAPSIEAFSWSIESTKRQELFTSDRPVVLWKPPDVEDRYKGVGLHTTEEIWFVLDPSKMLVLSKGGPESSRRMGPERARLVGEHTARHCTAEIVCSPSSASELLASSVQLARRRPTLRFWKAPLLDSKTGRPGNEVLHSWQPIGDIPDDSDGYLD